MRSAGPVEKVEACLPLRAPAVHCHEHHQPPIECADMARASRAGSIVRPALRRNGKPREGRQRNERCELPRVREHIVRHTEPAQLSKLLQPSPSQSSKLVTLPPNSMSAKAYSARDREQARQQRYTAISSARLSGAEPSVAYATDGSRPPLAKAPPLLASTDQDA